MAEFSIGLFFACLFTFQLIPILVTIGPALVRASVLILIHPGIYFFLNLVFFQIFNFKAEIDKKKAAVISRHF